MWHTFFHSMGFVSDMRCYLIRRCDFIFISLKLNSWNCVWPKQICCYFHLIFFFGYSEAFLLSVVERTLIWLANKYEITNLNKWKKVDIFLLLFWLTCQQINEISIYILKPYQYQHGRFAPNQWNASAKNRRMIENVKKKDIVGANEWLEWVSKWVKQSHNNIIICLLIRSSKEKKNHDHEQIDSNTAI